MMASTHIPKCTWASAEANKVAMDVLGLFAPECHRIDVAGSLRRGLSEVGDVEIVCIPRNEGMLLLENPPRLFGASAMEPPDRVNLLDLKILNLIDEKVLDYRLNEKGSKTFGPLNKFLVHVASGIGIDVYCCGPLNWGMTFMVRTGPKEFNIRFMRRLREFGMRGHAYGSISHRDGSIIHCREEIDVFAALRWEYMEPSRRFGGPALVS